MKGILRRLCLLLARCPIVLPQDQRWLRMQAVRLAEEMDKENGE